MKTAAIIVAGGSASRFGGDVPKQFLPLCGKPLLSQTINKFQNANSIDLIVIVVAEEYLLYTSEKIIDPYHFDKVLKIVIGGETRRQSVLNGLNSLPLSTDFVAIHDAARPLIKPSEIDKIIEIAQKEKAVIFAQKSVDTIKRIRDDYIMATLDRNILFQAQTPQVFAYDLIRSAHEEFEGDESSITDDASLLEQKGFKVKILASDSNNMKVTTKEDFKIAELLLSEELNG
ncbi:MAG: 2-C-methyl-D-erythritol 4-phosphate cytidylyltransferase [Calditrichaeota bacterium]|nr:MAG: 2-C-methyl-D-erythritol 4-phosphate cytidylyltransferase [Calditrichota bacterium]